MWPTSVNTRTNCASNGAASAWRSQKILSTKSGHVDASADVMSEFCFKSLEKSLEALSDTRRRILVGSRDKSVFLFSSGTRNVSDENTLHNSRSQTQLIRSITRLTQIISCLHLSTWLGTPAEITLPSVLRTLITSRRWQQQNERNAQHEISLSDKLKRRSVKSINRVLIEMLLSSAIYIIVHSVDKR